MTIDIRVIGTANLKGITRELAAVQAEAAALSAELNTMLGPKGTMNPKAWDKVTTAVQQNSAAYRSALNSTGQWESYQKRVASAADQYTKKLERQRVTFRDMFKSQGAYNAAYREQLKLQKMVVRGLPGVDAAGRHMADFAVPTEVHKSWDTLSKRVAFFGHNLRSASVQMVNWGKNMQWSGRQLSMGLTMPLVAFGAVTGTLANQVDQQMTRIKKVYNLTADQNATTVEGLAAVNKEYAQVVTDAWETAKKATVEYGVAAKDTLDVQAQLAAQGLKAEKLQASTLQVMRVSALGELPQEDALKTVISLQNILKQNTKEVADSLNYMNSVENNTSLSTQDFAQAIPIALGPLKEMGGTLQDLGLLMVALKERGVQANQGANAIKSMMTRLYRPSKQVLDEWKQMAGIDLTQIVEGANGNVMDILAKISASVKGIDRASKIKLLSGLFGTYQVTRLNDILQGIDAANRGIGQTSNVLKINEQGWEQWGQTANTELKNMQESASGKLKRAFEGLKNDLIEMGKAFLPVATDVVKILNNFLNFFRNLPGPIKSIGKIAIILGAATGPILMLIGLFGNLIGMVGRFTASILLIGRKFRILDRETAENNAVMKLAERGFLSTGDAANFAALQIGKIAEAMGVARASMAGGLPMAGPGGTVVAGAPRWPAGTRDPVTGKAMGGKYMSKEDVANSAKVEENTGKTKSNVVGMGIAGAVFTGAMIASAASSNKIVDDWAQIAMTGAILLPIVNGMANGAVNLAKNMIATRAAAAATAVEMEAGAAATVGAEAASGGFLAAMGAAVNPVTLIVGALAAVGATLWYLHKRSVEQWKDEYTAVRNTSNAAQAWAESAGATLKTYKRIALVSADIKNPSEFENSVATYKTGALKDTTASFRAMDGTDRAVAAQKMFVDLTTRAGLSAKEAETQIKALYVAIGNSISTADQKATDLYNKFGKMNQSAWSDLLRNTGKKFSDNLQDFLNDPDRDQVVKRNAADVAETFSAAFAAAKPGKDAAYQLDNLANVVGDSWQPVLEQIQSAGEKGQNFLDANDIKNAKDLAEYSASTNGDFSSLAAVGPQFAAAVAASAGGAGRVEKALIGAVANAMHLSKSIDTLPELLDEINVKAHLLSFEEGRKEINRIYYDLTNIGNRLDAMNAINLAHGIKEGTTATQSLFFYMNGVTDAEYAAGQRAYEHALALREGVKQAHELSSVLKDMDWNDQAKSVFSDVQSKLGDIASQNFQNQMDDAMKSYSDSQQGRLDALQRAQDKASTHLENRQQAATDKFEKQWDARKKAVSDAFDDRINKINAEIKAEEKAEEVRKRIFDAEMARIQRMNDVANANIDFNVALASGNLDEAARLRANMQAETEKYSLDQQDKKAEARSKKTVDRLNTQVDRIGKIKDARLKALDDIEEKERKALERSQQRQTDALQRHQEAVQKSLQTEVDNNIAAQQEIWDNRKEKLDEAIALFQAYVPVNEKDLREHVARISKQYDDFNVATTGKFHKSAVDIDGMITYAVKDAANSIKSDVAWEAIGQQASERFLSGALGMNIPQFIHWMQTGTFPKNVEPMTGKQIAAAVQRENDNDPRIPDAFYHEGGLVGSDRSSRKGVARTAGLHPSERLAVLQDKEFVVNKQAAAENLPLLQGLNNGRYGTDSTGYGTGGFGAIMGGVLRQALINSLIMGIARGALNAAGQMTAMEQIGTGKYAGASGTYGDLAFSAEQMKNAATIASVGSNMGMSKRDIEIGIMTAITESGLRNVNYGDRDSLGLFQQRPSAGWGTPAEVTNPKYAAGKFFSALRAVTNRGEMPPWLAAQAVQRSAFADGSNYRQYWNEAIAIVTKGLTGGSGAGGYIPGPGGRHRPVPRGYGLTQGIHDQYTGFPAVDFGVPVGTNVYSVADGRIISSYDLTGNEPRNSVQNGYYSYGRVITVDHGPFKSLYAHLNNRFAQKGQSVKGGSVIGKSGNTGHSTGPHLHFGTAGISPMEFVNLSKGAQDIRWDNTIANLHKGEAVLTEDINRKFKQGVDNFANGGNNEYNLHMHINNPNASADEIAGVVISKIKYMESRKPRPRKSL